MRSTACSKTLHDDGAGGVAGNGHDGAAHVDDAVDACGEGDNFVTLRYYSSYYHNIFHSDDSFPFVNGSQQGTASAPLPVAFKKE